jgi:hypothetical protein
MGGEVGPLAPIPAMTLITYQGRVVAEAGRDRFTLAPDIAQRSHGDPVKRFVCFLALYARDVLRGELPDEPRPYVPARAERYARACLLPESDFRARARRTDHELARIFRVPVEEIPARRREVRSDACVGPHAAGRDDASRPNRPLREQAD